MELLKTFAARHAPADGLADEFCARVERRLAERQQGETRLPHTHSTSAVPALWAVGGPTSPTHPAVCAQRGLCRWTRSSKLASQLLSSR
eukprot:scaffold214142_cov30-Tisochrysis_lutea.AAC.1